MEGKIQIDSIKESSLDGSRRPEQVSKLVSYILDQSDANGDLDVNGSPKVMSTQQILDAYKELREKEENVILIPDNSISTLLSALAKSENYPIYCQGRKQGYFYKNIVQSGTDVLDERQCMEATDEQSESSLLEKDIYPYLISWLQTKNYDLVQDISTKKRKGQWRNPDILGIKTIDVFKTTYIEIVTIEAKLSKDLWTKEIFEAIAHTVFSNKSYFAYLCKESDKVDDEMIAYAQKFNIGILQVMLSDEKWKLSSKDIGPDDMEIREILPAPEQKPLLTLQKRFLKDLGINDFDDYKRLILNGKQQTNAV